MVRSFLFLATSFFLLCRRSLTQNSGSLSTGTKPPSIGRGVGAAIGLSLMILAASIGYVVESALFPLRLSLFLFSLLSLFNLF